MFTAVALVYSNPAVAEWLGFTYDLHVEKIENSTETFSILEDAFLTMRHQYNNILSK